MGNRLEAKTSFYPRPFSPILQSSMPAYLFCDLPFHFSEGLIQDSYPFVDLLLGDDERGSQENVVSPDSVRASPSRVGDQSFFKGPVSDARVELPLGVEWLLGLFILNELDSGEESSPAHIPFKLMLSRVFKAFRKYSPILADRLMRSCARR